MHTTTPRGRFGLAPMLPRDGSESHRTASPLELFFDLVFVVAVSFSSARLHTGETEGQVWGSLGTYLLVFFSIWWAWTNFTWFASAFDTDDWAYRALTILQMAGALVLAAGTPQATSHGDFFVVTLGYVIMRIAMVCQWLRAAHASAQARPTALRYAAGIVIVQVAWVARLFLPDQGGVATFLLLVVAELLVPVVAEHGGSTNWHPHHIAERYSLFTLILLGESILASTSTVVDAIEHTEHLGDLLLLSACGLILATAMWWVYFSGRQVHQFTSLTRALGFGYGHYVLFAAAGSFSAGIEVAIDLATHTTHLAAASAAATLTVPIAIFFVAALQLTLRQQLSRPSTVAFILLSVALAASALLPASFSLVAAAAIALVIVVIVENSRIRTLQ